MINCTAKVLKNSNHYLSKVCRLCSNMSISSCNYSWHATRVEMLLITGTNTRVMWGFFQLHAALGKRQTTHMTVSIAMCLLCRTFIKLSRYVDVIRFYVCATPCKWECGTPHLSLKNQSDWFRSQSCFNRQLIT